MEENRSPSKDSIEDGELSNDSFGYTPLQRPGLNADITQAAPESAIAVDDPCSVIDDEDNTSSHDSSSDGSSIELANTVSRKKKKNRSKYTVERPTKIEEQKPKTSNKYNVWTATIQENTLTENMLGCGVTNRIDDRNVENYDIAWSHKSQFPKSMKRRISNNSAENETSVLAKRSRRAHDDTSDNSQRSFSSSPTVDRVRSCKRPRVIMDLKELKDRDSKELAREITTNLNEENEEMFERIVEVMGADVSIEIYKDTQRVEKNGGMMIMTGKRRRTPGGVFLCLLKQHPAFKPDHKKILFRKTEQNTDMDVNK